ncbi:EF-P beta-lysylation protein EpmB [Neptunicella marina]|uniref:L-lysine 2,3-aminomutase n=1 Tax=Neptunicella marina TaxID=2125989 RepID=A0A8J6IVD2_9ALTE|nr:EF-P beta-lysylation protein EpmB [Neptunicella marina]
MIPNIEQTWDRQWQKELAASINDPLKLLQALELNPDEFAQDIKARRLFPLRVPLPFVSRMQKGNVNDPLFLQVFSQKQEFEAEVGYSTDPLKEQDNQQPGILHKYKSRVLLIIKGGCAVNCRYCFRRHFPYADNQINREGWLEILQQIAADANINEVIYSGGDPLMAKDDFLKWLTQEIAAIPHITRLRIHTRLPVVIPSRINDSLLNWFTSSRLKPVMVLHINHANEIDQHVAKAAQRLKQAGVTLLNQAVLLKNINDSADAQFELNEKLFEADILPYYLHMLDKVQGAQHYDVSEQQARKIMAELIRRLPGYLVPKLVREIGGQPGKTPMDLRLHP